MAAYARFEVATITLLGTALTVLFAYCFAGWALAPALLAVALLAFYRDPARRTPREPNLLIAPADGKVVEVARGVEDASGGGPLLRIMIFLSVFDVHVNRSPCAGRVREVAYRAGEFVNALRGEADSRNECNMLVIEPVAPLPGPVRVRQIAGVLARRIVCAVRPGDELTAGQRFGMIKLGSRTELCVPDDPRWEVCVGVGQRVRGGKTVLARLAVAERESGNVAGA